MKLSFTLSARNAYGQDDVEDRSVTIDFDTADVNTVVSEFNKFLILNDFDAQVQIV